MFVSINTQSLFRAILGIGVALLYASPQLCAGETVVDNERGFKLTLPDGFEPHQSLVGAAPSIIHAFVFGDPTDDKLDIILIIEKLRGIIGRERLTLRDMPSGFQGRLFSTKWQEYDVDAFVVPEHLNGVETVTYNVQIPLKGAAIQVKLFGPADREADLKPVLAEVLSGLTGESSWTGSSSSSSSITSSDSYRYILLAFAIVFILGGLVLLFLISNKAPKGTVLMIAGGIYGVALVISDVRVREVALLAGAMKMLGFSGGILGIIDLVRKKKPHDPSDVTPDRMEFKGSESDK